MMVTRWCVQSRETPGRVVYKPRRAICSTTAYPRLTRDSDTAVGGVGRATFGNSSANKLVCIQTQIHDAIAARMVRAPKEYIAAGNLRSRLRSGTADRAQQTLDFQKRLSILYCD